MQRSTLRRLRARTRDRAAELALSLLFLIAAGQLHVVIAAAGR